MDLFTDADIISSYTRAEALHDGDLVDVTTTARDAGFSVPVALTQALWADIQAIPKGQSHQDVPGRLWDVLYMGFRAALRMPSGVSSCYQLIMHVGRSTYYTVKMTIGPGDAGEPVITLMRPDES